MKRCATRSAKSRLRWKSDVGRACAAHPASKTENWERRFYPKDLPAEWEDAWELFEAWGP